MECCNHLQLVSIHRPFSTLPTGVDLALFSVGNYQTSKHRLLISFKAFWHLDRGSNCAAVVSYILAI